MYTPIHQQAINRRSADYTTLFIMALSISWNFEALPVLKRSIRSTETKRKVCRTQILGCMFMQIK